MIKGVFSSHICQTINSTGDCSCLRSWRRIRGIQKFPKNANIKKKAPGPGDGEYVFISEDRSRI